MIGAMARFSSSSKSQETAIQFSVQDNPDGKSIIYKVFITNNNSPGSNVDLRHGI